MIFNKNGVSNIAIDEFRLHVPILDKRTDFELLVPDIENAEYELQKIIGKETFEKALATYAGPNGLGDNIVTHVQSAVANIAFRDYTVNNDLRHSLTGRKASVNPANEKQAWEFLIDKDNEGLNFKVQKALNRLIDFLDTEKIVEWTSSPAYRIKHEVLLFDLHVFTQYYPIDNSLALFNQLLPIQMEMQRKHISPLLGKDLLARMLAYQAGQDAGSSGAGYDGDQLGLVLDYAGPSLALWTMATGIKRLSIKLLPEGLVQQFKSSVQSRNSSFPVKSSEKDMIIAGLIRDAQEATEMLENQLKIIDATISVTVVVPVSTLGDRNIDTNKYFSA